VVFRRQTEVLLSIGFGGLLILMGMQAVSSLSFLHQIDVSHERIRNDFVTRNRALENLRSDIYFSGTHIRDYLLSSDPDAAKAKAAAFVQTRNHLRQAVESYAQHLHPDEIQDFRQLQTRLPSYLNKLSEILTWSQADKTSKGEGFIQNEVLPRRVEMLALTDRIERLNERWMEERSHDTSQLLASFRLRQSVLVAIILGVGLLVAGLTFFRIMNLEKESEERFAEILTARSKLEELSSQVLEAQEKERRAIARELHDEVGQALWAISLGLDNVAAALKRDNRDEAVQRLSEVREMSNRNVQMVRNISLLLRPSMLDDLGLLPALKWLARETSRNSGVNVEVQADELPDSVPDEYKTCLYRVVQEALRNCCRHAHATQACISIRPAAKGLVLMIQDNGTGFDPSHEKGLGLIGMEERVKRIGGFFQIKSSSGLGTTIALELPWPSNFLRPAPGGPGTHGPAPGISAGKA
jgi:signal transduction histidine kinase